MAGRAGILVVPPALNQTRHQQRKPHASGRHQDAEITSQVQAHARGGTRIHRRIRFPHGVRSINLTRDAKDRFLDSAPIKVGPPSRSTLLLGRDRAWRWPERDDRYDDVFAAMNPG